MIEKCPFKQTLSLRTTAAIVLLGLQLISCSDGSNPTTFGNPVDSTPPVITSRSPEIGATQVALDTRVVVAFNEHMQPISINSVTFQLLDPIWQIPVSGMLNYNDNTNRVTFTPTKLLAEYSQYSVIIDGFTDALLNPLPKSTWQFTTADITPSITTSSPAGGFYNTPQNIKLICQDENGSGCAATYFTLDGTTPTQNPAQLYNGAIAIQTLNNLVTLQYFSIDKEGNDESIQSEEYVIDTIPPTVATTFPPTNAENVVLTEIISATFSEPVLPLSLTSDSFLLTATNHQVTGTVSLNETATVASFTADERLECNTLYTATITTETRDRASNRMLADFSWSFTSHKDCDEPKTTVTPNGGVFTGTTKSISLQCADSGSPTSGCKHILYTTDGSVPSFSPLNGMLTSGTETTLELNIGDTYLRYYSEDNAGNREAIRESLFSLSDNGYTYVATEAGLSRGVGPIPDRFVNTLAMQALNQPYEAQFVDPSNQRIYLLARKGFFISDDNGTSWYHRNLPNNSFLNSLYANGSRVFAGSPLGGLFVSNDGAASFQPTKFTAKVNVVYEMDTTLFVSTNTELWRSTDRGHSFSNIQTADVMAITSDGINLYVATRSNGILISDDRGETFITKTIADGLGSDHITDVFVAADNTVYVATNTWPDGSPGTGGLSISTNQGASFTTYTEGLPTNNLRSVVASGSDVYVSGYFTSPGPENLSIAVSNNGGTSFTTTASMRQGLASDAVADMDMVGNQLFAYTEGGLSVSGNGGVDFTTIGFGDKLINDIAINSVGTLYVTNGSGISISTDGGYRFKTLNLSSGLPSYKANKIDVSPDGNTIHVTTGFINNNFTSGYAKSTNGGGNFTQPSVPPSDSVWKGRGNLAVDGSNIYIAAGYVGYALLVSNNEGMTFTEYPSIGVINDNAPVDVKVAADGTVFVSTHSGIGVSTNNGATFDTKLTQAGNNLGSNRIGLLHIDGNIIYAESIADGVGTTQGLSVSVDGGTTFNTWTTANGLPHDNINSINTYAGYLYIGTDSGLAISDNGGASFTLRTDENGLGYNRPKAVLYQP